MLQVSWHLTQGCDSSFPTRSAIWNASPRDARERESSEARRDVQRSSPSQHVSTGPGEGTSSNNSESQSRGPDNTTNYNDEGNVWSRSGSGDNTDKIRADPGAQSISNSNEQGCSNFGSSSSWQLRQHFPPDALVPRAQPTYMFARATTKTTTLSAQQAGQAQDTVLARVTSSRVFQVTEARPTGIATVPSSQAASTTARARTSESGKSTPQTLVKVRKSPHTARTRLNALGVSSAGMLAERTQQSTSTTKQPPENMGKLFPDTGQESMKIRAGATAEMEDEEERRAVGVRNDHGGDNSGDCVEHQTRAPQPTQPVCKAPSGGVGGGAGAPAVAGAVVGLTAETLARPAVVLDRSGRVTVVEEVTTKH